MHSRNRVCAIVLAGGLCSIASTAWSAILISIDKSTQQMTVSVDGVRKYAWPVSTGRSGYATPSGNFKPFRLEKDHFSKEWDDAPMPHSIFFTTKGHAIHGSYETRRLGSPASHGCVRLAPGNASKLFALVKAEGLGNTKVVLTGQAPPMIARRPAAPAAPRDAAVPMQPQPNQTVAGQPGYAGQPAYGTQPAYGAQPQPAYGAQPTYQPQYAAQPQYQQPARYQAAPAPRNQQPAYGAQPYEQSYDPRFGPRY